MARNNEFLWVKGPPKIEKGRVLAQMTKKAADHMGKINLKRKVNEDLNMFIILNLSWRYWQWSVN